MDKDMSNEIKEILEDNGELLVRHKDNSFICFDTLPQNVLDYIINLQQKVEWYEGIEINKTIDKLRLEHNRQIKDLQQENERLKKLEYKFFYCSEDEESFTLEDYLELGNKVYDLEQEKEDYKSTLNKGLEYIENEIFNGQIDWYRKNGGCISGSDLPCYVILDLYDILQGGKDE